MPKSSPTGRFLLCVKNEGYPASLDLRKVHQSRPDAMAEPRGFIRVIDESGEAHLYPFDQFVAVELPQEAARVRRRGLTSS